MMLKLGSAVISDLIGELNVSLPYHGSKGPLNLLIDSSGIKAEGEGEWNARKRAGIYLLRAAPGMTIFVVASKKRILSRQAIGRIRFSTALKSILTRPSCRR